MDVIFSYEYLTAEHLEGLKKYKYSAIDTSPLSNYVMHPSWNFLTKFLPKWMAPNLITFIGFLCMVLVTLLLTVFDYDLRGGLQSPNHIPNWVFTACGVLIFLAYHLDGIDGKQARRLGVSGPLGELFDHGLDSYIVFFIPFSIASIFGKDPVFSIPCFRFFLIIMSVVLNFYVSHCEKYNTGTLYLPWGYDVSMWVSSGILVMAGVYEPTYFKFYLSDGISFALFFEIVIHIVGVFGTLPVAIYNVYVARKNGVAKVKSLSEALRPIWSMLAIIVAMATWALKSPNNIIDYDTRAFILLFGTLFSNTASRLMVAGMCYQRCNILTVMFWPLIFGVFTSLYQPEFEVLMLYALVFGCIIAHVHYGVCVVRQICRHYKIECFTVPKEKQK